MLLRRADEAPALRIEASAEARVFGPRGTQNDKTSFRRSSMLCCDGALCPRSLGGALLSACRSSIDGAAEAVYMINGIEVNRIFNMTYNGQPLSEGFISVQAEWAELYYRNIRYKLDE
jgi:hypothetical protein